jgi:MerR family mercuric resistance operon transcriptional regulator
MPPLTIGRLAAQAGVGVETVRFYQRRGLLQTPRRPSRGIDGGTRRYGHEDVRRLKFIRSAQAAGFTLKQISELLALDATEDRPRVLALAREGLAALNQKIAELEGARSALRRLERHCRASSRGPCPIIEAFEKA